MADVADPKPVDRPKAGEPRTSGDAAALARHDHRIRLPLILSAVLPLILVPQQGHPVAVVVGIASWLVFLFDFVVHLRRSVHYLGTRFGKFDLVIVVLTAPWFLLPGAQAGGVVVILRLARLVRLVVASRGARRLFAQLGRVALVAVGVLVVGASVAYYAEHPTNPEFATYWDALWWAIVTLTTVGYGDIVPETATGRWAGSFIMVTGIAVLGVLAGSLASFFRLDRPAKDSDGVASPEPGDAVPRVAGYQLVMDELTLLRAQVAALTDRLGGEATGDRGATTTPGD